MESTRNEGGQNLSSLFSFSEWRKSTQEPKIRRMELVLIFGIGILLGITLKTMATNSLTIGYEDYTVVAVDNRIDLNQVEKSVLARNESPFASNTGKGGYCSQE